METKIIEVTNGEQNWGKFMLGRFTSEWLVKSEVSSTNLLNGIGHGPKDLLVLDLETCEGAIFSPHGYAHYDLEKHRIWVCPMFEPFLEWLYKQDLSDLNALPAYIDLPGVSFEIAGHRRKGVNR